MKDCNIIVPTWNEEENIQPLLQRIYNSFQGSKYTLEVIFVDDGSSDNTIKEISDYAGPLDVRLVSRDSKKGLASAIMAGAEAASSEVIVVMDADLSHPPEMILQLVEPLVEKQCDMVIGSRYVQNGRISDWPLKRRIGSLLASIPARFLTGIKDPLSGFFAVKKSTLLKAAPSVRGYKIGLEILAGERKELQVREIPIHFQDRSAGHSKMTRQVAFEYIVQLLSLYGVNIPLSSLRPLIFSFVLAGGADAIIYSVLNKTFSGSLNNHLFSYFIVLHLCFLGFISYQKLLHPTIKRERTGYLTFLNIACFGLFLRGGLLALSGVTWGTQSVQTILILSMTTALTVIFCWAAYCSGFGKTSHKTNPIAFIFTLTAYSLALRFLFIATPELLMEEAYYWNYAQHMSTGYLDHPPGVAVLIWIGTALFGNNEFGVRFGTLICWFITAGFTYKFAQSIFNSAIALRSLLLVAVLPIFFITGFVMTPDAPLVASWAGAIYFLHGALVKERLRSWFGTGICLGIGLASKYTIAFLGPAILLFMIVDPRSRKLFLKPHPYLAALLAVAIFSPVILWNYQHEWASFLFQSKGRLTAASEFSTHELLLSIIVLLTPTGFLAVVCSLKRNNYTIPKRSNSPDYSSRSYTFCLVMAFVPLMIFTLFSLTKPVKLSWTGPLWLSLLPFIACSMAWPLSRLDNIIARSWRPTAVICVLIYGTILHYWSLGLPGIPFKDYPFLLGWQNLAAQVENIVQTISEDEGQRPVVACTGTYRIASGLAFYRFKGLEGAAVNNYQDQVVEETTSSHIFGHNSLMYQYWHKPEDLPNSSMVVISRKERYLSPTYLRERYSSLGPVKLIHHQKNGKVVGTYFYRHIRYSPAIQLN